MMTQSRNISECVKGMCCKITMYLIAALLLASTAMSLVIRPAMMHRTLNHASISTTALNMGTRQRAWAKGDLSDKDIFEAEDEGVENCDTREKNKLKPELIFYEGPPDASELLFPALSIITVIGIIPFASAAARQLWVRYKFTSRRINIVSGIGGNDESTIIYPDVEEVRFVFRAFGKSGDMVLFLKDGAKVELRHVPNFVNVLNFVLENIDKEAREKSQKIPETFLKDLDKE